MTVEGIPAAGAMFLGKSGFSSLGSGCCAGGAYPINVASRLPYVCFGPSICIVRRLLSSDRRLFSQAQPTIVGAHHATAKFFTCHCGPSPEARAPLARSA
jgi:hypothetical protein